jgi:hypothetical protein
MHLTAKSCVAATLLALLTATGCNRTPAYEWRPLEAPDGTFSVAFPGDAVQEDAPTKSVAGGSFISHSFKSRASKNAAYGCSWWEDPSVRDRTAEQILDAARDNGLSGVSGRLLGEKRLTVQGHPARDIRAIARGNAAYDNRLVVVGNRLYTLLVLDVSGTRDSENIARFFDSLVLH